MRKESTEMGRKMGFGQQKIKLMRELLKKSALTRHRFFFSWIMNNFSLFYKVTVIFGNNDMQCCLSFMEIWCRSKSLILWRKWLCSNRPNVARFYPLRPDILWVFLTPLEIMKSASCAIYRVVTNEWTPDKLTLF